VKAWELKERCGPQGLHRNDNRPTPTPKRGEAAIRVRACSLNYRDLLIAAGKYAARSDPHLVPLSDGAGEVVAVGEGVTRLAVGDRVVGVFFQNWLAGAISSDATGLALGGSADGMLAEYVVLPEHGVARFPDHLSFVEAACLPCAAVTAWNAVVETAQIRAGQTVLLLGAGGVSIFALQFAKLHGARVIVTSSSDEKLARLRELGADAVINYRTTPDWDDAVAELTDGRGVDLVVEVGGPGTLQRSIKAVRTGGTIALIGVLTGQGAIDPRPLIGKAVRLQGVFVGSADMLKAMFRAMAQGAVHPVVDRVFAFDEAPRAYEHLASGAHFGKVAIDLEAA
jgi:NADPH:quinone reductase-like Zn-dependent oxidoreductase